MRAAVAANEARAVCPSISGICMSMMTTRTELVQAGRQAFAAAKDDNKSDVSLYYMFFAETLLNHRGVYEAWRLQSLTNLAELPDYDEGYYGYREYNGAPVDADGKPVYHTTPKNGTRLKRMVSVGDGCWSRRRRTIRR
jgi:hypothetical protein